MLFEKYIRIFFSGKEKATTNTWNDYVASAPKPSKNDDDTIVLSG